MYNNTIKVENKIISAELLADIFARMNERLLECQKIYKQEFARNQILDFRERTWTFNDYGSSKLVFNVDFYDNTYIKFDNFISFISIYNSRLNEIKSIDMRFYLGYEIKENGMHGKHISEHINMYITEKKMSVDVAISSDSDKIRDIFKMIEEMVLSAPEKYDLVVKQKNKISNVVGFAIGSIPAIIVATLLLFYVPFRNIASMTFVAWPILTLILSFIIGNLAASNMLGKYYQNIVPDKVYNGYDAVNNKRLYRDDIENYIGTSEILIGKNCDNMRDRESILEIYKKYKKWPLYEIGIILLISIVVLFF